MKDSLDFQAVRFPCRAPEEAAEYQGYKIRVFQDAYPTNPWEEWDGQPPLLATGNAGLRSFEYGNPFASLVSAMSDGFILENQERIAAEFDIDMSYFSTDSNYRELYIRDALRERYAAKPVAVLKALCRLLGIECYAWESRGFSQGDSLECLLVAAPAWIKETGISKELVSGSLADGASLFDAYVWGEVYAFIVENPAGGEIDSGGGYYGDYSASGLVEDALSAVDADIERRQEEARKLANVPLQTA